MGINPINFGPNFSNNGKPKKVNNRLADIEFNIITDTLRTKNCQKNVDFRLKNLKQNLEG